MNDPIEAERLLQRLDAAGPPLILDVRSAWEYRRGRVPGARHVPFWRPLRLQRACRGKAEVVVICGHGPRAWMAAAWLRLAGTARPRLLRGHMSGWKRRGLPLER